MKNKTLFLFALFCACIYPVLAYGQVQTFPYQNPNAQFFTNSGLPCAGCTLTTFAAGTTSNLATYSDSAGTVPNSNPLTLDSAGRGTIYMTSASYKFVLKTAAGVTLVTQDNISAANLASTLTSLTLTGNATINSSTAATNVANQSGPSFCMDGNFWNGSASAVDSWCWNTVLGTGTNPTSTLTLVHSGSSGTPVFSVPALSASSATVSGAINNVQYVNGTDADCGLAAAYALLPSTGGTIKFRLDCTISASQTFTLTALKPVIIDLSGRTLTFSHASGIGLQFMFTNASLRYQTVLENGKIACSGCGVSTTGIQVGTAGQAFTGFIGENLQFNSFTPAGATALSWVFVEDSSLKSVQFNSNDTALFLGLNTNQNLFTDVAFTDDATSTRTAAIVETDAAENVFMGCLVQSVKATKPVQINASTVNIDNNNFINCHFENDGDGTTNTRVIAFNAAAGKQILSHSIFGSQFNLGTLQVAGANPVGFSGAGSMSALNMQGIIASGVTNFFDSGVVASTGGATSAIDTPYVANYDVGLNAGGLIGLSFNSPAASTAYQIFGGSASGVGNNNLLVFKDVTHTQNIAAYSSGSSTWVFQKGNLTLGTSGSFGGQLNLSGGTSGSIAIVPALVAGSNTITLPATTGTVPLIIASGTSTFTTTAVGAGACQTTVTTAATNALTSDTITTAYTTAPVSATDGVLTLQSYLTAGNVNFMRCNGTAGSITPTALVLNWRVIR